MITTDTNDDGVVSVMSDSVLGLQSFTIIPDENVVELILAGKHVYVTREALAELAVQFAAVAGT